jgi:propionate catabolism operon transcriptional regulator
LFLDEIGDMPLPLQSRLLRVLQEREITRLGATSAIAVDVRVVVATHQPLQELIAERRFRQDLYYRINTLRLRLPALRERGPDILALAQVLLARCLERHGCTLDPAAALAPLAERLNAYAWPGNVRELENIVERIAIWMMPANRVADIPYAALQQDCPELFETAAPGLPVSARREQIMAAMERAGGQRNQAAQQLGVSRSTLWRWLRELEAQPATAPGADAAS